MQNIPIQKLVENELTNSLYNDDKDNLNRLVLSISLHGIREPLIVSESPGSEGIYDIISGNRRKRAAAILSLCELPCIVIDPIPIDEGLVRAHQEQRVKKLSEILREALWLYENFQSVFKQGRRKFTKDEEKAIELRKLLEEDYGGKHVISRLRKFHELAQRASGGDQSKYDHYLKRLDQSGNLTGTIKLIEAYIAEQENLKLRSNSSKLIVGNSVIYRKSSDQITEVKHGTVSLIVTSPPYYDKRDYKLGEKEIGQEKTPELFVERLVSHLDGLKNLLTKNGTLWLVMGDYVNDYQYPMAPEKIVMGMMDQGWKLHDKLIWVKTNPPFNNSSRSLLAHEYVYVLKRSDFVKYDMTWVKSYPEVQDFITAGTVQGRIKLKSVFDFRDNVIRTSVANNSKLKLECEKVGVHLTHSATFPLAIPLIAILTSTDFGDLVMDPFCGIATVAKVAQLTGREFVGFELNPDYIKVAEVRLKTDNSDYFEEMTLESPIKGLLTD